MRESSYFREFQLPPPPSARGFDPLGAARVERQSATAVRLRVGSTTVEVAALAPDLYRVGLFADGRPPSYASEALARQDWSLEDVGIREQRGLVQISTAQVTAHVALEPLRLHFTDSSGRTFAADDAALGMGLAPLAAGASGFVDPLGAPARVYKAHPATERYFGCGERTGGLEKTGSHQVFWNVDPPSQHTASLNNLYTSVPFVLALDRGQAWGMFVDNPGRVEFDLAREDPHRAWFATASGDLIYYVFAGPTPREVLARYTELTGRIPLPPLWALGYHQSRWGYQSADELRDLAREFRRRDLPCDALYLDIDYMDGYRVFTWDRARFPDPAGLVAELGAQGFRVVTIVDPGVKVDEQYALYVDGRDADYYCKTSLGAEYHNVVWPGVCAFPDFADPRVRAWWGASHAPLLDAGVAGIWCDMNEPTVFIPAAATMPADVVHPGGGNARLHAEVHNLYGSLMAQATREGLERLRPDRRPFVISRSGYAGLQRHALHWTGDNASWWEHLAMSMPQLQNLGLAGLAWVGVDVGGFGGDATGELLARWMEFGIFQPFCRNHSERGSQAQEPWAFGERYEAVIRDILKLRQRLIPYLYSVFEESNRTGAPILRPLLYAFPDDEATYTADDEFLLGDSLLVAPIARPGVEHRHVYLPRGVWYHLWSAERFAGPAHILAHAPLGQPAVYVRANVPLPLGPAMNHVGERPMDPLTVLLFPAAGEGAFDLYEDAGDGYAHEQGAAARTRLACASAGDAVTVHLGPTVGAFAPARTQVELEVRGLDSPPHTVSVDGRPIDAWERQATGVRLLLAVTTDQTVVDLRW